MLHIPTIIRAPTQRGLSIMHHRNALLALALIGLAGIAHARENAILATGKMLTPAETQAYLVGKSRRADAPRTSVVVFPRHAIERLLAQPGAAGINAEFVRDPATGNPTLLLRGIDTAGTTFGPWIGRGIDCATDCARERRLDTRSDNAGDVLTPRQVQAYLSSALRQPAQDRFAPNTASTSLPAGIYRQLLASPEVVAIASHFVVDANGRDTLMLQGIDANGQVVGLSANHATLCPPSCPPSSTD